VKTAIAAVLLLAAAGAIGMGIVSAPAAAASPTRKIPAVVMRALPGQAAAPLAAGVVAKTEPAKGGDDLEPLAPRPTEVKPAEPKPAAVEAKPEPVAEAKPEPAKPEPKPAAVAKPEPKPAEPKPAPVAAEPKPAAIAAKPPPAEPKPAAERKPPATNVGAAPAAGGGATDGAFNLRASDTADVYIDGRKVGGSPVLGHRVKAGKHKIRFDCYDATGEAKQGITQTYEVAAEGERDVEYECPAQ
jgi:outer membrane biosynthesis protein TonB